ncbi:Protein of unknown function [Saccharopolyspora antimicrobica]|uniref:Uncharacterized protein DUF3558 n=1 Tax=Saccharopolyspora antimicrobica TaxID=455193 RepID=A0A1I5HBC3_9PSEU|nr:DUF3558 domain-containing protein [Saccharopolyspora antimicrobica]RKT85392.1 uncharacterized protein DUF3558 [Saccharopolyspora antimicrobica]SFO45565.1 Protein of unknown function [Saccharopolyspora antimicrobica]
MHRSRITGARRLSALLAVSTLALTGCSLWQSHPTADTAAPPPMPLPTTSTPPPPPSRPYELGLDGVSACSLLTTSQRNQLGFDRDPMPDSEAGFGNAATCSYRNTTAKVGARLALITTEGMGVWTDDTAQVEATQVMVGEFPALVIKTPGLNLSCNVAVDVAEGQHLDVLYRDDGAQPPSPVDQLCAGAQRVAEDAVATLADPGTSETRTPTSQPG